MVTSFDLLNHNRIKVIVLRLFPSSVFVVFTILFLVSVYFFYRKKRISLSKQKIYLLHQILAVIAILGVGKNFARLFIATSGIPTIFETLNLIQSHPECYSLFGSGSKVLDDAANVLALKKQKGCYLESPAPSRSSKPFYLSFLEAIESRFNNVRHFNIISAHPHYSSDQLEINKFFQDINIQSTIPFLSITPVNCYPRPFLYPIEGFHPIKGMTELVKSNILVSAGFGDTEVRLIHEAQYLCMGIILKRPKDRKLVEITSGQIFVKNLPID